MNTIALIPARGGSKGVPRKNIRPFCGVPLIVHSIKAAQESHHICSVWVSTDDAAIAKVARDAGASVIHRPERLAGDTATTESAVEHALAYLQERGVGVDRVVLLQATSPLRPPACLDAALEQFHQNGYDSLVSLSPTHRFFWTTEDDRAVAQYDYTRRPRRQDMKEEDLSYVENGSFYIFTQALFEEKKNRLGGTIGYYCMGEEYSYEIDTEADFLFLESLAKEERGRE
ncbi:cytidylyltransferase domain-containing protein [Chitinivibrio alkaliphilus]|uniref:N-acylneuraminate cytidylyltransferase n=1 Tax=Chitinivibrio alkaliphilus ACht1 TaxID=1313304 RepID=U7DAX0_9BACT|nr:acylneuraminate cytidylyltransferase family protein [Chitinivibrio alkaliphilus]ERP39177.1 N-acylneuraminate cytidylyltransferase [Chitinivibrio alkaliphilus ACht1]